MYLTVRLEHVAALEVHAAVTPNVKLKYLQNALELLRQCQSIMEVLQERDPDENKEKTKSEDGDENSIKSDYSLLNLFENRLHFILKSIIQYCRSKSNKDYETMTEMYKKLYCASLKIKKSDNVKLYASSICDVLDDIEDIMCTYQD
ncbi:unnamed protein product [Euphydryas editha]|uniref:EDRF1 TPR repeats region domain-containing protein n=1 Tax=Euphydryas editha TaxID=104508 RepID=A0AAU9UGI0_EUPED|nr:unnamed protein product [Euphydryas editha]